MVGRVCQMLAVCVHQATLDSSVKITCVLASRVITLDCVMLANVVVGLDTQVRISSSFMLGAVDSDTINQSGK